MPVFLPPLISSDGLEATQRKKINCRQHFDLDKKGCNFQPGHHDQNSELGLSAGVATQGSPKYIQLMVRSTHTPSSTHIPTPLLSGPQRHLPRKQEAPPEQSSLSLHVSPVAISQYVPSHHSTSSEQGNTWFKAPITGRSHPEKRQPHSRRSQSSGYRLSMNKARASSRVRKSSPLSASVRQRLRAWR